jgi:hypothetical protein
VIFTDGRKRGVGCIIALDLAWGCLYRDTQLWYSHLQMIAHWHDINGVRWFVTHEHSIAHSQERIHHDMAEQYYTLDTSLFDGRFRYFGSELVQVRSKVHQSEEHYSLQKAETDMEPVQTLRGTRTYLHMKPFVLVPDIRLTVGLYPTPTAEGAIGEVLETHERKHREVEIGQAQAWYYPRDQIIILWECFLHEFVRDKPLLEDPNMRALWEHVAPFHDPLFETEEYHQFLSALGYQPVAKAAWGKPIEQA